MPSACESVPADSAVDNRRPIDLGELATEGERVLAARVNRLLADVARAEQGALLARQSMWRAITRLEANLGSLNSFRRIAESLGGRYELLEICHNVLLAITQEIGVEHASIMLLDPSGSELRLVAGASRRGLPAGVTPVSDRVLRLGEGVAGRAAASQKVIRVDDVADDPTYIELDTRVPVRSLLCIPLTGGAQSIGVLNLSHPEPRYFRTWHDRVFAMFCPIVGQLIAFAQLQARLAERNEGLEEEVRRRNAEVRDSQIGLARREKLAALGETVSGIAHELNNRLLPIVMYSEDLLGQRLPPRTSKQVRAIADSAAGVRGIVESLLGFSRQRKLNKVAADLNQIVESTVSVLKFSLHRDGILVRTQLQAGLAPTMADPLQVEQVLVNLIRNAQHAVLARDTRSTGVVVVSTASEDGHLLVRVRDNGCGISPENMGKIMQPFFTTKAPGEGTGLGLALCYGILSEHGGDIQVRSQPGDTVFTLRFPQVEPVQGSGETAAAPADDDFPRGMRLLIVDDEELILDVLHDVLDGRVAVDTATSGLEALQKLASTDFDAVLTDMRMPGLGGREIYRWLAEHRPGRERRVVFATGDTFDPDIAEFIAARDAICLAKPFTLKAVVAAIRQVAGR